ncbi:MAG: hypothetical protein CL405_03340 [Acidimicrobiaceae bacterium]|nr:hypothetical protein [Acidimicrobiaceae bacterium]
MAMSTRPVRLLRMPATATKVNAMATRLTWYIANELVQSILPAMGKRSIRPDGSQSKKRGFNTYDVVATTKASEVTAR